MLTARTGPGQGRGPGRNLEAVRPTCAAWATEPSAASPAAAAAAGPAAARDGQAPPTPRRSPLDVRPPPSARRRSREKPLPPAHGPAPRPPLPLPALGPALILPGRDWPGRPPLTVRAGLRLERACAVGPAAGDVAAERCPGRPGGIRRFPLPGKYPAGRGPGPRSRCQVCPGPETLPAPGWPRPCLSRPCPALRRVRGKGRSGQSRVPSSLTRSAVSVEHPPCASPFGDATVISS